MAPLSLGQAGEWMPMTTLDQRPAAFTWTTPKILALTGAWTARGLSTLETSLSLLAASDKGETVVEASGITALDTAGAWSVHSLISRLQADSGQVSLHDLPDRFKNILASVESHFSAPPAAQAISPAPGMLGTLGHAAIAQFSQLFALLSFVGECAVVGVALLRHPTRLRWRPMLFNLRTAGFDALPIVGLLGFLLGVVVAYQGAEQLRRYGANIFIADLVGLSMLREFSPLITAIIVAGRSGSAYAAQIGTMSVTEEIDAMRTLGIPPIEMLVWPKVIALVVAMPLLTVLSDAFGVGGGMIMAQVQLDVGFPEFLERFAKAISITDYVIGIAKAPVFAMVIVVIGCFQGFLTHGGPDSVGVHTTRSVVQSIFLVIVFDALFSVAFSALDL